jgi:hypothetical protein
MQGKVEHNIAKSVNQFNPQKNEVFMPQEKARSLITQLHEMYGNEEPSEQQKHLMEQLELHTHPKGAKDQYGEPVPLDTLELLVEEMAAEHPRTAAVMREILETLKNIGV